MADDKIVSIKKLEELADEFELCVRCRAKTPYFKSIPINFRNCYIDVAGQLCGNCYNSIYNIK